MNQMAAPGPGVIRQRNRRRSLLLATLVFAALDLAVKVLAENRLSDASVDLGALQPQLAHNNGVAFSLGHALPSGTVVAVTAVITVVMALYGWHHVPAASGVQLLAGGAILGGAVANVLDRTGDGVVTDYLHTGWWPTFNLADTFLVLGIAVLVLSQLTAERRRAEVTADTLTALPSTKRIPHRDDPATDQNVLTARAADLETTGRSAAEFAENIDDDEA